MNIFQRPTGSSRRWVRRVHDLQEARCADTGDCISKFSCGDDSKLTAGDVTGIWIRDVCFGSHILQRATMMQRKMHRPATIDTTEQPGRVSKAGSKPQARALRHPEFLQSVCCVHIQYFGVPRITIGQRL